ncbi:hypothetical protein MBLNU13_g06689t1 [Cladosporium sp. NU13]
MWTQDWLHRIRSGNILSVEPTGRNDAAIADQRSALEDADVKIVTHDDDTDFVVISHAYHCEQPCNATNASRIENISIDASSRECSQQLVQDCEEASISRGSAHSINLCGRGDHNHSFQDLRSASQAIKRDKNTRQKYYNFKYIKPGEFKALHHQSADVSNETRLMENHSILTKAELYRQAQLPPRPPKYHRRHIDKIRFALSQRVDARREARKHGKAIMEGHLRDL